MTCVSLFFFQAHTRFGDAGTCDPPILSLRIGNTSYSRSSPRKPFCGLLLILELDYRRRKKGWKTFSHHWASPHPCFSTVSLGLSPHQKGSSLPSQYACVLLTSGKWGLKPPSKWKKLRTAISWIQLSQSRNCLRSITIYTSLLIEKLYEHPIERPSSLLSCPWSWSSPAGTLSWGNLT